ncbi:M15 family metallopeptidase [Nocardioides caldifontis]|uniref:M15 family metallopeptidase n=1 Tax=Nocardioides caldifontis TaxID=2588938 RepID=UPI0013967E21|nr:M15 family metallopeptidase [Nocardioides caldifontis]
MALTGAVLVTTVVLQAGQAAHPGASLEIAHALFGASDVAAQPQTSAPRGGDALDGFARERYQRAKRMQAERMAAMTRPSRDNDRRSDPGTRREDGRRTQGSAPPPWLQECMQRSSDRAQWHSNGQIPSSELCALPESGHLLHGDAAAGWWRLNVAFTRRFGAGVCITDSYRSYGAQASVYASKPGLAAAPGTSNHGWGVAMDWCGGVESYTSPQHQWLARNGARFGWVNPGWAQAGGSRPEPWHWEYDSR